jgi:DNA-3-methyladenine glycosylase
MKGDKRDLNIEPFLKPLPQAFYNLPTLEMAQMILGCLLVKETKDGIASGMIVETEAYKGPEDRAAHSFGNRRTKRTEIMFGEPGYVYTYVMHTHCLVNVVSGGVGKPEAVLIRAVEPYSGFDLMNKRRPVTDQRNLTNGPGKLTKALGIGMEDYGHPIFKPPLYLAEGIKPEGISCGKRIGINNSGEAKDYPWRFWISGNKFVSK